MKTITKHFNSIAEAGRFQNRLYNQYNHVIAKRSPMFSESGSYTWEVSGQIVILSKREKEILIKLGSSAGWTFAGDNLFKSPTEALRLLKSLTKKGLVEPEANEFGTQYIITAAGRREAAYAKPITLTK